MSIVGRDSLKTRRTLRVGDKSYDYFSLAAAADAGLGDISRLPYALKVLLENLLRNEDGRGTTVDDAHAVAEWLATGSSSREIAFRPARVLLQDFTGVPAVVDLAAMRDAMVVLGGDPSRINPLSPVDLVIDHSVVADRVASPDAFRRNVENEMARNGERYAFLRWGQGAFDGLRVMPPGAGICHQINLEYLARVVWTAPDGETTLAFPDTLVGADSHTTMVNSLAVLGWGVGGIEAEAALLGQPISMLIPEVVGVRLAGRLKEGATATDLVLTVVRALRDKGVVGKFVEFFGPALDELTVADRATVANMAPEYGATCGFFPVDSETLKYLEMSSRPSETIALVEAYAKAQGLWRDASMADPVFSDTLDLDIGSVEPSLAGPKRPQDKVALSQAAPGFKAALADMVGGGAADGGAKARVDGGDYELGHGDVVIAAITSCTNTSNPSVMVGAGLLARNAVRRGLTVKPWVKTSLAPGSRVVTDYLAAAGLDRGLDALGFNLVGYGCTTCIGNSGPLPRAVVEAVEQGDLVVCSVLSGNRNFESRISPLVRANYLASPPLVVAYALAGSMTVDLVVDPLGEDGEGNPVYLRDIWPTNREIQDTVRRVVKPEMFASRYADIFTGDETWRRMESGGGMTYDWSASSTYIQRPPFFDGMGAEPPGFHDVTGARVLALLGDSITTDHLSPAGSIAEASPAGQYLIAHGVEPRDFSSYGARRGNHEVMLRGAFANPRLRNEVAPGTEGGWTRFMPSGERMTIYDAAMKYKAAGVPLVVVGGRQYGGGSSRDWAAKAPSLLGVEAVIVESFERIHRSNLVGMGVLPLVFTDGVTRKTLALDGSEVFDITGLAGDVAPGMNLPCRITRADGSSVEITLGCRIDTPDEVEYYRHGGILHYVLREMAAAG